MQHHSNRNHTVGRSRLRIAALLGASTLVVGMSAPAYAAKPTESNGQQDKQTSSQSHGKAADHKTSGTSGTSGDVKSPQPKSKADRNGTGANHSGPYDSTRDGSPSGNGNGKGKATGKPCAGCVGKADNKNPKGQYPNGSDHNAGYECDRNHGIGRSNPAHTGCTSTTPPACEDYANTPEDECGEETTPPTCEDNTNTPKDECDEVTTPPTGGGSGEGPCEDDMTGNPGNGSDECDEETTPPTGGEECPVGMPSSSTGCTSVSPPTFTGGNTENASSSTEVSAASVAPKAQAEGAAAPAKASNGFLPQTGAAALLLWAALAGMLLVVAGAASLVLNRIRARA